MLRPGEAICSSLRVPMAGAANRSRRGCGRNICIEALRRGPPSRAVLRLKVREAQLNDAPHGAGVIDVERAEARVAGGPIDLDAAKVVLGDCVTAAVRAIRTPSSDSEVSRDLASEKATGPTFSVAGVKPTERRRRSEASPRE